MILEPGGIFEMKLEKILSLPSVYIGKIFRVKIVISLEEILTKKQLSKINQNWQAEFQNRQYVKPGDLITSWDWGTANDGEICFHLFKFTDNARNEILISRTFALFDAEVERCGNDF